MFFSISGLLSSRETDISLSGLACINLLITYFNIELKRTKLTSHTDTKRMDMSDRYRLRDVNTSKSFLAERRHFPNDNWQLGGSGVMGHTRGLISCYQSVAPISAHELISLWYFWCLRNGKIDVITYKYVINTYLFVGICISCNMDWIIWRLVYCTIFVCDTQDRLAGSIIVFSSVIVT